MNDYSQNYSEKLNKKFYTKKVEKNAPLSISELKNVVSLLQIWELRMKAKKNLEAVDKLVRTICVCVLFNVSRYCF